MCGRMNWRSSSSWSSYGRRKNSSSKKLCCKTSSRTQLIIWSTKSSIKKRLSLSLMGRSCWVTSVTSRLSTESPRNSIRLATSGSRISIRRKIGCLRVCLWRSGQCGVWRIKWLQGTIWWLSTRLTGLEATVFSLTTSKQKTTTKLSLKTYASSRRKNEPS